MAALQNYVVTLLLVATRLSALHASVVTGEIGVDYGLNGNDLLSPKQTVALLRSKGVSRVRIYEARQEITQAFANSGIELMIGIPNELVPKIAVNLVEAINWVTQNVAQFPNSGISAVIVGNEWLLDPAHDPALLLPAMLNTYTALTTSSLLKLDLNGIKVSTSHALSVLGISYPPSAAAFEGGLLSVLSPLLDFLVQTDSFFMVNIFPYFAYVEDPNVSLEFALFEARQAVQDPNTKLNYTNLFDLQLDAVYAALDAYAASGAIGLNQLDTLNRKAAAARRTRSQRPRVVVGETGWPSGPGDSGTVPHATLMNTLRDAVLPSSSPPADVSPSRSHVAYHTSPRLPGVQQLAPTSSSDQRPSSGNVTWREHDVSTSDSDVSPRQNDAAAGFRTASAASAGSSAGKYTCSGRECSAASVRNARTYNQNLIRHVLQSKGTPANPTTPIQAFIFEVFNENLKPPGPEQHYGLFFPNGTPVYPITFH